MKATRTVPLIVLLSLLFVALAGGARAQAQSQIRAYWADAFHNGIFTAAQADQLIADTKASNCNMIVAQVRRRGNTYYPSSFEPYAPNADPNFDALAYLIEKAHAQNPPIKVHAWLCTLPIWNTQNTPPASPYHPFNLYPEYLSHSDGDTTWDGSNYVFDMGNPDALQYTHDVYLDVVKRYPVDGIHYDYIRFAGNNFGYNPVAVARYQKLTGTTGAPNYKDAAWLQWRRDQVTAMVRKIYIDAVAINPKIEISGSTITWGSGPGTNDDAWATTSAYSGVLQDWRAWMEEGILDINMPMTYYDYSAKGYPAMYTSWIEFQKNHKYNRQLSIGLGVYLNSIANSLTEINLGNQPSTRGLNADGFTFYSYSVPNKGTVDYTGWRAMLTTPGTINNNKPPYATIVPTPDMPWKSAPTKGMLRGTVRDTGGVAADGAEISLAEVTKTQLTDGTGFYGFVDLAPGAYNVTAKLGGSVIATGTATIEAGKVATLDLSYAPLVAVIADDSDTSSEVVGNWASVASGTNFYGTGYRSVATGGMGDNFITWHPALNADGTYKVYARWPSRWDNSTAATYTINHDGGETSVKVNQTANGGKWVLLGTYKFSASGASVTLTDKATRTNSQLRVVADAVMFEGTIGKLGRIWTRSVPGGAIDSSPTAGENAVFVGSPDGHVYAMNPVDGGYLWRYPNNDDALDTAVVCRPVYDGVNVYYTYGGGVRALNATTGEQVWDAAINTSTVSPVATQTTLYVCTDDCHIAALDKSNGHLLRTSVTLPSPPTSTPAIPGTNTVWVGTQDGNIVALSEDLSTVRFTRATGGPVVASPNVDAMTGRLYVGSMDGKFYCLNASTGTNLWGPINVSRPIASSAWADTRNGKIYFGTEAAGGTNTDHAVYALNANSGTTVPGYPFVIAGAGAFVSSPVVVPGAGGTQYLYIGSTNGSFYAVNAADPSKYRVYTTDPASNVGERLGEFRSSPAILPGSGLVVAAGSNGKLYGFKLQ